MSGDSCQWLQPQNLGGGKYALGKNLGELGEKNAAENNAYSKYIATPPQDLGYYLATR